MCKRASPIFKMFEDCSLHSMKIGLPWNTRKLLTHTQSSLPFIKTEWPWIGTLALSVPLFERPFLLIVVIKQTANRPIACEQSERVSPREIAKFLRAHLTTIANRLLRPCGRPPWKGCQKNNGCLKIRQRESEGWNKKRKTPSTQSFPWDIHRTLGKVNEKLTKS